MYELYAFFPDSIITWKDLVFMSMAFTVLVSTLGFPPIVSAIVSVIFFALAHVIPEVADKENTEERKVAFIASLLFGVAAGYIMAFKFASLSSFIPSKIIVVLLCIISIIYYGEILRFWKLNNEYSAFIIDKWMRWRDIIFIALALSFPLGAIDSGIGPVVSVISTLVFYGFMKNYNADMDERFTFLLSLIIGITCGAAITFKDFKGGFNFTSPIFVLSMVSFINYLSTLYDIPISVGVITLLFSIIPALALGKNPGLSMFVSVIVSMSVLIISSYNKTKEKWLFNQSIYIGLLVGICTSIGIESLKPTSNDSVPFFGAFLDYLWLKLNEPLNTFMIYTWIIYFVNYILSLLPSDNILPLGWKYIFDDEKLQVLKDLIKRDQIIQKTEAMLPDFDDPDAKYECEIKNIEY